VDKGFPTIVHHRQREPKEPHFSRGHEAIGLVDHNTPTTIHHRWLHQGQDLHVSHQCHLPYNINPFTDEVLCDIAPLDICDVLLGQPYLWKRHVVYESRPHALLLLPWEIICTGYQRYHHLSLSLWLLQKNAVRSFPKLGNLFSDDPPLGKAEDCGQDL
jgi:hypothetical protein